MYITHKISIMFFFSFSHSYQKKTIKYDNFFHVTMKNCTMAMTLTKHIFVSKIHNVIIINY